MDKSELYDLKYHLSYFIAPRLRDFKEIVDNKQAVSIPKLAGTENLSLEEKELLWSEILGEMIFPFEYHCFPDKYADLSLDEINLKTERGLQKFAEYFENLWL